MAKSLRRRSVKRINRRQTLRGGGRRCDTWRTRLAVLQSKLALKSRHKGFDRLGKQLHKLYLDLLVHFCNDRFKVTEPFKKDLDEALQTLQHAYDAGELKHKDLMIATMKIQFATAGVNNRLATRLLREVSDPHIAYTDKEQAELTADLMQAIERTHHYPVL